MKEKIVVLAKTYPVVSRKYEHLVCVGGMLENGKWRRIYPVPWERFWKDQGFKKKHWIEYETQKDEPSDHRTESRKIFADKIKDLGECPFKEIKSFFDNRLTDLEKLSEIDHKEVSLGVIKPYKITNLIVEENPHYHEMLKKEKQTTLDNKSVVQIWIPPKTFSYTFRCSSTCKKDHKLMCEDWELLALYKNCEDYRKKGNYKDENEVIEKVKQKFLKELPEKKDLYFVVGTHYRFPTYMIVGVIYPKKTDKY